MHPRVGSSLMERVRYQERPPIRHGRRLLKPKEAPVNPQCPARRRHHKKTALPGFCQESGRWFAVCGPRLLAVATTMASAVASAMASAMTATEPSETTAAALTATAALATAVALATMAAGAAVATVTAGAAVASVAASAAVAAFPAVAATATEGLSATVTAVAGVSAAATIEQTGLGRGVRSHQSQTQNRHEDGHAKQYDSIHLCDTSSKQT